MNRDLLREHVQALVAESKKNPTKYAQDFQERQEIVRYYGLFTEDRIRAMTVEDVYDYISQLWAMQMWGNKHYRVNQIIDDNGLQNLRQKLAYLLHSDRDIAERWDSFRVEIKGMGPAMISEILCRTYPQDFMIWNRRAYIALRNLEVGNLPRYDYQLTGKVYSDLCDVCKSIAKELSSAGSDDSLLSVDYFFWERLQGEDSLSQLDYRNAGLDKGRGRKDTLESKFIHDDIRDKLRDIGEWLGFNSGIEQRVAEGSHVDTIWEATIGNMGRVIYVFEVQTKGSIDSLTINLLKSLNNPAVQGVVAVSDREQLEKIKKHTSDVPALRDKLRHWDYEQVLKVYEDLAYVNECINNLGLVPQGF